MKPKKFTLLLCLGTICAVFMLSACERSASTPPVPSMTPNILTAAPTFKPVAITLVPPGTQEAMKAAPDLAKTNEPTAVPTAKPNQDPNSPNMGKHVVRSGETLYMIGRAYGVSPMAIADSNHITEPYTIFPGQSLDIPKVRWPGGVPQGPVAKQQFDPNF
jgi:LysM repeat protein